MLVTVPAVPDPPVVLMAAGHAHRTRSLADRDEYGPITGRPGGLFTATAALLALDARDELGRRTAAWVPDGDLL